jgi:hypothetical protein
MSNDAYKRDHVSRILNVCGLAALLAFSSNTAAFAQAPPFDGRLWNLSTRDLSVGYIQGSTGSRYRSRQTQFTSHQINIRSQ